MSYMCIVVYCIEIWAKKMVVEDLDYGVSMI
jgi:hypothetical protein